MANVLVRDLDDDVLKQLKAAAKAHGRSLQAEIHDVLQRASTRNLAETRRLVGTVAEATAAIVPVGQRRDDSRGSRHAVSVFVVDASVVIKWFVPEIHSDAARRLLSRHRMSISRRTCCFLKSAMSYGRRSGAAN